MSLSFADEGEDIGFESGAIFSRMTKQQFNHAPLTGSEMPVYPPASKTMQQGDWLLRKQLF